MSNYNNLFFDDFEDECCEFEPKCHEREPKCPRKCPRITLLEAVSLINQTVLAGLAVPFDTNLVLLGNGIIHTPGGTDFNLLAPGIYRVTFTGTVTPTTITTASAGLALNGSIIPGTTISASVPAIGQHAALATQAIVQVSQFISTVLTVVNPTANTEIFTNPNIIIEKIG
jgi:hypothetical protein